MNSNIFNQIGLGNVDPAAIFIGVTAVILIVIIMLIVQMVSLNKLKKKYNKFMQGKNAKSLETDMIGLYEDNKFMKTNIEKNKKDIRTLYKKMESAFQKVGIVKYDAFNQMGGKLSFSLALLDEENNGFILNSVHSTEGCYSYTKEIKNGSSVISLGEEEKQALDMAMGMKDEVN